MPLADRLAEKQVCACVAPLGSSFIHSAHPFHWYDAILLPVFNRPAGLSLQNVTVCPLLKFWVMQVFHHIQLLEALVWENGLDHVNAIATSFD